MAHPYGIKAIQSQPADHLPHILGFQIPRQKPDDRLLSVWNGPTEAAEVFGVGIDGGIWIGGEEVITAGRELVGVSADASIIDSGVFEVERIPAAELAIAWGQLLDPPEMAERWPTFEEVRELPTTLDGYGIEDALSKAGGTVAGNLVFGANYGHGMVGSYSVDRLRQVYAMGADYIMPAAGDTAGSFYGLAMGFEGHFGFPAGIGHAFGVFAEGALTSAIGSSIWTRGNAYATAFYSTSSRELKERIEPFAGDALALIRGVDVVEFRYRSDAQKARKVGFIAEDTDPLLSGGGKHLDVVNAIGLLLRAVQQLDAEVSDALR